MGSLKVCGEGVAGVQKPAADWSARVLLTLMPSHNGSVVYDAAMSATGLERHQITANSRPQKTSANYDIVTRMQLSGRRRGQLH